MMKEIPRSYYVDGFLRDMRNAESAWQNAENLKNRVDEDSKIHCKKFRDEAEFLIVAVGMINFLQTLDDFEAKDEFNRFLKQLLSETFSIRLRPKIQLVKP
ncbi:MAG: hypothetical protein HQK54_16265 [Oligoflexales bacterium]|nr:hypothetical protein [Oligoflexales bacterium]